MLGIPYRSISQTKQHSQQHIPSQRLVLSTHERLLFRSTKILRRHGGRADLIDIDISEMEIVNCIFKNSGNDAIDAMTSNVKITDTYISEAGDKGLSAGESSVVSVFNLTFDNTQIAIQSKDGTYVSNRIKSLGYNPLMVTVRPHLETDVGKKNLYNFFRQAKIFCHNKINRSILIVKHSSPAECSNILRNSPRNN